MPNLVNALKELPIGEAYPILEFLPIYLLFLIPFSLYYYIQYLTKPEYRFSKKEYLLLIPALIQLLFQLFLLWLYLADSPLLGEENRVLWVCNSLFEAGSMFATFVVLMLVIRKLNRYEASLVENYANIESQSLSWLKNTMIVSLLLWACWFIPFVSGYGAESRKYYYPLFLGQAFISYWLGYAMYSRRDIFENNEILSEEGKTLNSVPELSQKTDEHYQKLLSLIAEEKLFKNPDISMTLLAAKMKLSNGYLSQIINQKEGKNFFEFINDYRVEEVKRNLADPNFDHFSILGIGLEAGFKSKSTFNAVFKKMTGNTPTAYKRLLIEEKKGSKHLN